MDSIDSFKNIVKLPFVMSSENDSKLSWSKELYNKFPLKLYIFKFKQILPTDDNNCVSHGIFQSSIAFCITVWGSAVQKYI